MATSFEKTPLNIKFAKLAIGISFFSSSVYHILAVAGFSFVEPSPLWRHLLFILINLAMIVLLIRNDRWFLYALIILTIQQISSHLTYAIKVFTAEGRIDWVSVVIVLTLPLALWILRPGRKPRPTLG